MMFRLIGIPILGGIKIPGLLIQADKTFANFSGLQGHSLDRVVNFPTDAFPDLFTQKQISDPVHMMQEQIRIRNFDGKNFDWRTKLLDLKGDGDFRYLIIADYHTGTSPDGMKGYVIDTKDNFKQIATISVGEAFDLPYHNPKLIFEGEK